MLRKGVGAIVALFVAGLLVAFLLPIAVGAIAGPDTATYEQEETETVTLTGDLEATLDSTDDTEETATYTVSNDEGSDTVTVDLGATETATIGDTEVDVTLDTVTASSATTTYEYPTTYGWGDAVTSLWVILPLIVVLVPFLYFVRIALSNY